MKWSLMFCFLLLWNLIFNNTVPHLVLPVSSANSLTFGGSSHNPVTSTSLQSVSGWRVESILITCFVSSRALQMLQGTWKLLLDLPLHLGANFYSNVVYATRNPCKLHRLMMVFSSIPGGSSRDCCIIADKCKDWNDEVNRTLYKVTKFILLCQLE